MSRRTTTAALALLSTLGLAACSAPSDGGQATPAPPASSTATNSSITNPKDVSAVTDACTLLTPEQLASLDGAGSEAKPGTSGYGQPDCMWSNDNFGALVSLVDGGGPDVIFSKEMIERVEVSGYPAALMGKTDVICRIEVAVADTQQIDIDYSRYGGKTPELMDNCGMAQKLAAEVVKNLPAASS